MKWDCEKWTQRGHLRCQKRTSQMRIRAIVLKETSKIKNVIEKQMVVVTMIDDHDHDVHDDDVHDDEDDDDVTDCE